MKKIFALLAAVMVSVLSFAATTEYTLTILPSDLKTSYTDNNGEHTWKAVAADKSTIDIVCVTNQIAQISKKIQGQKKTGYIYNTTDLGKIKSITINNNSNFTAIKGATEHPTEGAENPAYFTIKAGSSVSTAASIVIVFEMSKEVTKSAITLAECEHGTVAVDAENLTEVEEGTIVTLSNTPAEGYEFVDYDVYKTDEQETKVEVKDGKFTMPAYGVTVSASFEVPAELLSIAITKPATKTEFYTNTLFNHDGIEVTATVKKDGKEFTKDVTDKAVFSQPDMTKEGEQTVTVSYTEGGVTKDATYTITLSENPVQDLSEVYTSNVELTADGGTTIAIETCSINGEEYAIAKAGKSKTPTNGVLVLTLPMGAVRLHYHAIAWNNAPLTISVTVGTMEPVEQEIRADAGLKDIAPYILQNNLKEDYYVIAFNEPLKKDTKVTFEGNTRFAIFGVNTEADEPTAIEETLMSVKAEKVMLNGQLMIVREGKMYNMSGMLVK